MNRVIPFFFLMALSGLATAAEQVYSGPDCSKDSDRRVLSGLWSSMLQTPEKYEKYMDAIGAKDAVLKIKRLSSMKISKEETRRLMLRRATQDGIQDKAETQPGGSLYGMYMKADFYRQYYLIESNKGFQAIAEFYSTFYQGKWPAGSSEGESCANDLENIYIISDRIYGHTVDFASW